MTLLYILLSTSLISLIAFIGALTLFFKEKLIDRILLLLVSFSAGALIGGAFLHLLLEAIVEVGADEDALLKLFLFALGGFILFFILEHLIRWHHHHAMEHPHIQPFSYLVLVSDGIHNLIDGIIIAASFMVSIPIGMATTIAVALHEIPQELGDYGVLVYGGIKKKKALLLNYLSATTVILGGFLGWLLADKIGGSIVYLLPLAAGDFIYIASADLIPEIKYSKHGSQKPISNLLMFLLGIGLMLLLRFISE